MPRQPAHTLLVAFALLAGAGAIAASLPASAQPRSVPAQRTAEDIGTWRLDCTIDPMTDRADCVMRHRSWIEVPKEGPDGTPGMAFEMIRRGEAVAPAITSRGLGLETVARGLMAFGANAQIRFDRNPMVEAPCAIEGRAMVCVPRAELAAELAKQMESARTVLVRFRATTPLPIGGPTEPVALDLSDTARAMARFRQMVPAQSAAAPAAQPPVAGATSDTANDVGDTVNRIMQMLGTLTQGGGQPGQAPAPAPGR